MPHVELHRHGKWSLLDGAGEAAQWAARAVEIGMPALSLSDHGSLTGILDHISACRDVGIVPIAACEFYFRDNRLLHVKENLKKYHITLLAMSLRGWRSLVRLSTDSYKPDSFYDRSCVDPELMARHSEDVYCLAGCVGGRLASHLLVGYEPEVVRFLNVLRSIYGDRLAIELQPHEDPKQVRVNLDSWRVAYDYSVPLVVTGDAHYPTIDWAPTQDVRLMCATKRTNLKTKAKEAAGEDVFTMHQDNPTLYLMSREEKRAAFQRFHPDLDLRVVDAALDHSGEIVSRFTPFALDKDIKMPRMTRRVLSQIDPDAPTWRDVGDKPLEWWDEQSDDLVRTTLRRWAYDGLAALRDLYPSSHWDKFPYEDYECQLEHEFSVFDEIGPHVTRYLVMAAGEIRWARTHDVIVGPARGSSAASLVCYCTGITEIDPISYGMIFERFINPGRRGMPDVDIDFMPGQRGRGKVMAHTASVYGESNVVDIAAFGTYGPKSAIRAVCRVFDDEVDYTVADTCSKALDVLDSTEKPDLNECAERFDVIARFKETYPHLWQHAIRLENHPFSYSRHASGVLVKRSSDEIPLATRTDKETGERVTVTAWPDTHELLANEGFLKLDYLVIDGLIRQHEILTALREREDSPVDLSALPVRWDPYATDPEVMEMFSKGLTDGVWQMAGKATVSVLKAVRPSDMFDLAAINAIIRPGPRGAGMVESYARRKHKLEPVEYWHDSLEEVLDWTYGLIIYHENVMQLAMTLADFTPTEADDLRKAMGKKYREGMKIVKKFLRDGGHEARFIQGASSRVGEEAATMIWNKVLAFGGYSFAFPHAGAYGLISYHDMFLKVKAPADFYSWLLSYTKTEDMSARLGSAMREGRRFGVSIKPPSINHSDLNFKVLDAKTIVYGLESVKGVGAVGAKTIFEHRPYSSYQDFDERVPKREVNKSVKKALVGAGAFDEFSARRMLTEAERAAQEVDYMGVRLSVPSDADRHSGLIEETIHTEQEFDEAQDGEFLCVGGEITSIKATSTRAKGEAMGFVSLAFGSDNYRVTLFPAVWSYHLSKLIEGEVVLVEGVKEVSDKYGASFVAKNVITLGELLSMRAAGRVTA